MEVLQDEEFINTCMTASKDDVKKVVLENLEICKWKELLRLQRLFLNYRFWVIEGLKEQELSKEYQKTPLQVIFLEKWRVARMKILQNTL